MKGCAPFYGIRMGLISDSARRILRKRFPQRCLQRIALFRGKACQAAAKRAGGDSIGVPKVLKRRIGHRDRDDPRFDRLQVRAVPNVLQPLQTGGIVMGSAGAAEAHGPHRRVDRIGRMAISSGVPHIGGYNSTWPCDAGQFGNRFIGVWNKADHQGHDSVVERIVIIGQGLRIAGAELRVCASRPFAGVIDLGL
jgi:hypothetical protein